jgi:hypothetical protein
MSRIVKLQTRDPLIERICKALGVEMGMTRRVILDFQVAQPIVAYVEMYGSTEMCDIVWSLGLEGAQIEVAGEKEEAGGKRV